MTMRSAAISLTILAAHAALAHMPAAGSRYVSMGSSYAAGPGVGSPDPTGAACERSSSNYARLVAARAKLKLVDVFCSGAVTGNILVAGQHGLPAQIDAVTADTGLVTVLIGGNDIDYVGNLTGLSCRDAGGADCRVTDAADVQRKLAALPAALDRVIGEVRRRAPVARIILVGYLPAIPATGSAPCAAVPLTPGDAARVRDVAGKLAAAIEEAAERNRAGIVRAMRLGIGHDVCAADAYLAGYHPARSPGWPAPVPYHPTQAGMDAVARAIEAEIAR